MDSGNSSGSMSMQSSDEEYDSRAHSSLSSYITPPPPPPPQPQPQPQHHMFLQDPLLTNYLDIMWSKPNNNQSDLPASFIIPSSSQQQQEAVATNQQNQGGVNINNNNNSHHQLPNRAVRNNPKKRSRASRRAPTTVLTTDTTNFRAMVQEFTGIPPPPFTSSPFPRTRFDLFASSSSSSLMDPSPPPPPYLLRPFPQRLPPPYSNNSSIVDSLLPSNNSAAINFQQPISSSLGTGHPLNPAILSFQNMLQQAPPPKYPSDHHHHHHHHHHHAVSVAASKPQPTSLEIPPPINTAAAVGVFEEVHLNNNVNMSGLHHHDENIKNRLMSSSSNDSSREEWGQRRSDVQGEALYSDVAENTLLPNSGAKVQQQHYSSAPPPSSNTKGTDQCTVVAAPRTTQGMLESWINSSSHHNLS